jgi:hypothetical protein
VRIKAGEIAFVNREWSPLTALVEQCDGAVGRQRDIDAVHLIVRYIFVRGLRAVRGYSIAELSRGVLIDVASPTAAAFACRCTVAPSIAM